MSLTFNSKEYVADSYQKDSVTYIGAAKTVTIKDDLKLARVAPKPVADFSGVGRASGKLTKTLTLTGAETPTGDLIINYEVSVPVGASSTDVDNALADMAAFTALSAVGTLVKSQKIAW